MTRNFSVIKNLNLYQKTLSDLLGRTANIFQKRCFLHFLWLKQLWLHQMLKKNLTFKGSSANIIMVLDLALDTVLNGIGPALQWEAGDILEDKI
jgi:hypothetical protein